MKTLILIAIVALCAGCVQTQTPKTDTEPVIYAKRVPDTVIIH